MLERLSVRGLGIIDTVELELAPGFSVLTGETGAGKSLLVESLKLLGGRRAQSDMVRSGDERLLVEGVFNPGPSPALAALLDDLGVGDGDSIVLRREVTAAGRSRCWINDVAVTAGSLLRVAPHLLSIHGQHEQHGLADTATQRRLVDEFGDHGDLAEDVEARFAVWRRAADELERLRAAQASRRDRLDAIAFQLQEIAAIDPRAGEDEELRRRRLVLQHAARLTELSSALIDRLSDGEAAVVDALARAERELAEIADCGLALDGGAQRLAEARVQIEEVVREVQGLVDGSRGDPQELEAVESRLHALDQLMLKYGSTLDDVLTHRERLIRELEELESVEERVGQAESAAKEALAGYDHRAAALDHARRQSGAALATAVEAVLARLAMEGARLEFRWQPRPDAASPLVRDGQPVAFDEDGVEECELLMAANPGEELRPMARIASGGELSLVHLARRTALRGRRAASGLTLLFDEVDSGLGGAAAAALADLLSDLAATDQVLVVTHLPQVAARAESHFRVEKVLVSDRATTRVTVLSGPEREAEVARMLAAGDLTDSARAHARVLLAER